MLIQFLFSQPLFHSHHTLGCVYEMFLYGNFWTLLQWDFYQLDALLIQPAYVAEWANNAWRRLWACTAVGRVFKSHMRPRFVFRYVIQAMIRDNIPGRQEGLTVSSIICDCW